MGFRRENPLQGLLPRIPLALLAGWGRQRRRGRSLGWYGEGYWLPV